MRVKSALEEMLALQMAEAGLPPCTREYKFAAEMGRKWAFDFAFPHSLIAMEVEGGQWTQGRHVRGTGFEKDVEKYNTATLLGWKVFRATAEMVKRGEAVKLLEKVL